MLFIDIFIYVSAFLAATIFLLVCGYFGTTPLRAVTFLTVAIGFQGLVTAGYFVNHLDIAPRYSGVLMGISNLVSNLTGFIATPIAKALTHEVRSYNN